MESIRRHWKALTIAVAATVSLAVLAVNAGAQQGAALGGAQQAPGGKRLRIGTGKLGPCIKAVGNIVIPGDCETDCVVYCTDPCSQIQWDHADCQDVYGSCKRTVRTYNFYMCRDCTCTWPYGGCVDLGLYGSGSKQVLDCE